METENVRLKVDQFLINNGWQEYDANDDFFHYKKQIARDTGIMIVNGQRIQQPPQMIDIEITHFGVGSIDDTCIYGYSVIIDRNEVDSVYVDSFQDFQKEIYSRFS